MQFPKKLLGRRWGRVRTDVTIFVGAQQRVVTRCKFGAIVLTAFSYLVEMPGVMSLFGDAGVEAAVWITWRLWRLLGKMDPVVLLLFFLKKEITCILCGSEVTSDFFTSCHMMRSYLNEIETFLKLGGHYHVTPWTYWTNRSFIYLFVCDVMLYKSVALGFIFRTWILSTSCDVIVQTNDIVGCHV